LEYNRNQEYRGKDLTFYVSGSTGNADFRPTEDLVSQKIPNRIILSTEKELEDLEERVKRLKLFMTCQRELGL